MDFDDREADSPDKARDTLDYAFDVSKGTICLPYTQELPEALIMTIDHWCYSQ